MSDETDCSNANHSIDDCDAMSCYLPRKKIKLTTNKNGNVRSLMEKIEPQSHSNSWKFIDKNETMIAELSGGKLTLWQFLLELLMNDEYSSLIKWTDRNIGEFILIQAEEVAKLWGIRKDRNHRMNYDKLSRALRYYYQKNIIKKVHGHKFVYRFVSLVPETIAGSGSFHMAIASGTADLSPPSQLVASASDTETSANDTCGSRTNHSRASAPSPLKSGNKNNKKSDFNSTLTALFQAALLSLSGSNPEMTSAIFSNHKESESRVNSPKSVQCSENAITGNRIFDMANQNSSSINQECICKPDMPILPTTPGMFFSSPNGPGSSLHLPPFDRQSMLHFNRHSMNMQRLSQEILLHATAKSRFNPCLSNSLHSPSTDSLSNSIDQPNHNFWLNQFARDLYKSTASVNNPQVNVERTATFTQLSPDGKESPEVRIKTESFVNSTPPPETSDSNSLTTLFQKFVRELENKTTVSPAASKSDSSQQFHNYSNADLANLIKSQLSSHSSFVWMPVPVHFAEEIMEYCLRSLDGQAP